MRNKVNKIGRINIPYELLVRIKNKCLDKDMFVRDYMIALAEKDLKNKY